MNEKWTYRRGDIYLANLDPYIGSEQGGTRPVLVLQNNAGNYYCPTLIVAPLTSRFYKKTDLPTHCILENVECLAESSIVLLEQIKTIDKQRIKKYMGKISRKQMNAVDDAIEISLGLRIPEDTEAP
ncbi:MAG: type II toxin-antitoxin system PemK/MazF family toxin [Oscillospiraceae bacterium]|nr:type II toxin-antitoxin system PemK/MazF family toxin [Oscillospiraceae bacterium]